MLDIFYQIFNIAISTLITEVEMKYIIIPVAVYLYAAFVLYVVFPFLIKHLGA